MINRFATLLLAAAASLAALADVTADYRVVPLPQDIAPRAGEPFRLTRQTLITYPRGNEALAGDARFLASYIAKITGYEPQTAATDRPRRGAINLRESAQFTNREAYCLDITADTVSLSGTPEGIFYGIQTLRKAIPAGAKGQDILLPAATVTDGPLYGYRGAHFDVSRHFFTVDEVKSFIDMLALHNINNFHWHLSDDQGWRIEIKRYPRLTEIGSQRAQTVIGNNTGRYDSTPYGGYYTQDEAREIVRYAAERHINVIPEIDMPGHMQAALAAYPELGCTGGPYKVWEQWGVSDDVLCAGRDSVYDFIDGVLGEITDIFPSPLIHVGGDECPKTRWRECADCQAKIKSLGLADDDRSTAEQKLQSHVMKHAVDFLASRGRRAIGWEEILEGGLAGDVIVQSWTGEGGAISAARQGHDAIMSPVSHMYFDYCQTLDTSAEPLSFGGYTPLERVYSFRPVPSVLDAAQSGHILGPQANLWTEYIPTLSHAQYMELPRMAALAEVQWSSAPRDYEKFTHRLMKMLAHYDLEGYNYARHIFNVSASMTPDTVRGAVNVKFMTCDDAPVRYTLDGSRPTAASPLYQGPIAVTSPTVINAVAIRHDGESKLYTDSIVFSRATARPARLLHKPHRNYAAGGITTLTDGKLGAPNYRNGEWVGFYGDSLAAVIDLGRPMPVGEATIRCAVCSGDWVMDAAFFAVAVSDDGREWREVSRATYPELTGHTTEVRTHTLRFAPVAARYVRLSAMAHPELPRWHPGAGNLPFIFVDELTVR